MTKTLTQSIFTKVREEAENASFKFKQSVILVAHNFPEDLTEQQREMIDLIRYHGGVCSLGDLVFSYNHYPTDIEKLISKGYLLIDYEHTRP